MLCALAWIPRGVATACLTTEEIDPGGNHEGEDMSMEEEEEGAKTDDDGDDDTPVGIDDVLAEDMESFRFHKTNKDDPFLEHNPDLYDEEEIDDLTYRPTDMPIVTVRTGEEASQLEVYVYEDDIDSHEPNVYLHHETILPAYPLCLAWTDYHPSLGYGRGNLAAVGSFLQGIDIWDLNEVESLEPLVTLGGYILPRKSPRKKKGKNNKRKEPTLAPDSHEGEVMCVSWNKVQREYLASGSADSTVKCWDVESASCVTTLRHHSDKVQAVDWHPSEEALLVSASFDKTAQALDVRSGKVAAKFSLSADAEKALWNFGRDGGGSGATDSPTTTFLVTTEDGNMDEFDTRMADKGALWTVRAHSKATAACSLSSIVPGMLLTGSVDKVIKKECGPSIIPLAETHMDPLVTTKIVSNLKMLAEARSFSHCRYHDMLEVWDINDPEPVCVTTLRGIKAGAIFDLQVSIDPEHPFLVAVGGSKGEIKVLDLGVLMENEMLGHFGSRVASPVVERTKKRATLARESSNGGSTHENDHGEEAEESEGEE